MGFARLNIWVHDIQDPCRISDETWYVVVTDCRNRVVKWCGRRYADLPAKCGHRQVRLPPGCYVVWAALNVFDIGGGAVQGNYVTHFAFVNVDCHETACVHLYAPKYYDCWATLRFATEFIAEQQGFPDDVDVGQFLELGDQLVRGLARTPGDRNLAAELKRMTTALKAKPEFDEDED